MSNIDIVTKLRFLGLPVAHEAAAEIERLRAALQETDKAWRVLEANYTTTIVEGTGGTGGASNE